MASGHGLLRTADRGHMDGLITLRPRWPSPDYVIDWWLMNHSRRQPQSWHPILYQGNIALPWLSDCLRFLDQAQAQAQGQGLGLTIKFTGGEVTEWQDFPELLAQAHTRGIRTEFVTQAQTPALLWQELMMHAQAVTMDYHPGLAQTSVFLLNLDRALAQGVTVRVNLNMTREAWDDLIELEAQIRARDDRVSVYRHLLFDDPVFNTQPQAYSPEQLAAMKEQQCDLILGDQLTDYTTLVIEARNRYQGWQCRAGLDQCIVDAWGRVFRGHCRYMGYMGRIADTDISWPTEPLICGVEACVNAFDIRSVKSQLDAAQRPE